MHVIIILKIKIFDFFLKIIAYFRMSVGTPVNKENKRKRKLKLI